MSADATAGRVGALAGRQPLDGAARAALADRTLRRAGGVAMLANLMGAIDVFVLLWFVIPMPPHPEVEMAKNLVAAAVYIPVSFAVGWVWTGRLIRPNVAWLLEDRPPTDREREGTLRLPALCAAVDGSFWLAAAVLFGALNAGTSADLAFHVASTIVMGGITTITLSYLLSERIQRGVTARALAAAPPSRAQGLGVKRRLVLAWGLATGVPLAGVIMVACHALGDERLPRDDVLRSVLVLAVGAVGIGLVATLLVAKSVADPLREMRRALHRIEEGDLDASVRVDDTSEVGLVQSGFNRMVAGLRERERLRDLFGRHVGEDVARAALAEGTTLGGEVREVAALFVDLVGSTRLAAERPPQDVVALLNRFFAIVVDVVGRHGGWVNKFEGDAALVVFGAPVADDACASSALAAARDLDARLRRELPELDAGIGVSAGPALAGNVGAEHRLEYTVVGDPVNEAARLCELAKRRPERVVASASILDRARAAESARWTPDGEVLLRGRPAPTKLAIPAGR
ncbi:MAG TPA: adenylate/guanylate cyclase domain-containing protein [Solirubrobacteraceae bacterium]|jgi:adenylate cyclase|nr:adenylate/guanylate cyclase domain-containing protein [Solirubrobacteraceae bacterium]